MLLSPGHRHRRTRGLGWTAPRGQMFPALAMCPALCWALEERTRLQVPTRGTQAKGQYRPKPRRTLTP